MIIRSDQAVVIFKLVLGPGLAGPNQWQSMAAWCNACLPALAVDKPSLSSKRIICSCLHNVNTYGSSLLNLAVVRPLVGSGATNCHNMLVLGAKLLLSSMQSIVRLAETCCDPTWISFIITSHHEFNVSGGLFFLHETNNV